MNQFQFCDNTTLNTQRSEIQVSPSLVNLNLKKNHDINNEANEKVKEWLDDESNNVNINNFERINEDISWLKNQVGTLFSQNKKLKER